MDGRANVLHVLSHTHWDREWYQDFQGYRRRLAFQTDALLDLLERRPEFQSFLMDGQTSWVSDYLAVRPEQRERLARHLRSGRIHMGPWFVMPDELLLSGESLVHNLQLGHRICAEFEVPPLPVGYVTDVFGHCSQLPQILNGFGIGCAMLHRGTSGEGEQTEMVWEGAEGSSVLLIKVYPHTGYNDFLTIRWDNWGDKELREYEERKIELATTPVLFAMDGNDHEPPREDTLDLIERVNRVFQQTTCVHSSLPAYLSALRAALGGDWAHGRRRFRGELRSTAKSGRYTELMTGTASSRVPLKQANDAIEWLLARGADPLHAWARLLGADCQQAFLSHAWRNLLLNHPHDSIVGCSIDQVHRDMSYRFDQARLIGEQTLGESLIALADRIGAAGFGKDARVVTVVNLSSADSGPVTRFSFECNAETAATERTAGRQVALFDETGAPVPLDVVCTEENTRVWPLTCKTPAWYQCRPEAYQPQTRFHAAAALSVPALGYRTLLVAFAPPATQPSAPLRTPCCKASPPVVVNEARRTLENGLVALHVAADGRVTLKDKASGVKYHGLHVFEDCGDIGDGYNHSYPHQDRRVISTDAGARGAVVVKAEPHGSRAATLTVQFTFRVPADAEPVPALVTPCSKTSTAQRRMRKTVRLHIRTRFTLVAGERRVECRTTIQNLARRHRLRVLFPTRRKCETWFGDTAFDVVERPIALRDTTAGWKEQSREETPVKNVVAAQDGRGGLAILTRGLQEACVQDTPERAIALTLFRSFVETLYWQPTQDSLLLGDITVEYAMLPLAPQGRKMGATLMREADRYKAPLVSYTRQSEPGGTLPAQGQLLEIPAPLVLSTIKTSEDRQAVVVRVFNPLPRKVAATIRPHFNFSTACRANLLEVAEAELPRADNGGIPVSLGPKQVLTLRFTKSDG